MMSQLYPRRCLSSIVSQIMKYVSVDRADRRWSMGCGFNHIRVINGVGKGIRLL